jgi:hypothetical protein
MNSKSRPGFSCAAVSDHLLAVGEARSGYVLFFALPDGETGRYVFTLEHEGYVVQKLFFNPKSTELAVIFKAPALQKDICYIYDVSELSANAKYKPSVSRILDILPTSKINLDCKYESQNEIYRYAIRDARFSLNGNKIVLCTNHHHGSALVFIILKDPEYPNEWKLWGRHCLINELDNWDNNCLGYTGVSLYHASKSRTHE